MSIRVPTRILCQITGTPHGRFNHMVAAGLFPWVPPADKNHTRMWSADDILTIRIFRELLVDYQVSLHRAVKIANLVGAEARANPAAMLVAYVDHATEGSHAIALASLADTALWNMDQNFIRLMIFNIAQIREIIAQELASLQVSEAA